MTSTPEGVTKSTFEQASSKTQMLLLFDLLTKTNEIISDHVTDQKTSQKERLQGCNDRFIKLEKRKKVDVAVAGAGGFIGGFIAVIAKVAFWR